MTILALPAGAAAEGRLLTFHSPAIQTQPYWGRSRGTCTFTPRRRGTYRLTCLVHPTRMGQTLVVK